MSNLKTSAPPTGVAGVKTIYNYDDTDRLREIIHQDAVSLAQLGRSQFYYDGFSRKARAQEFNAANTLISETRYVFDGRNVIQERNASNVVQVKYVRGLEMGGGIGGLLSRTTTGTRAASYFYHYDGGEIGLRM